MSIKTQISLSSDDTEAVGMRKIYSSPPSASSTLLGSHSGSGNSSPDYREDISLQSSENSTSSRRLSATSLAANTPNEQFITKFIILPPMPAPVRNVATSCKPITAEVGFQIKPTTIDASTQTENENYRLVTTHDQLEAINNDMPLDLSLRSSVNSTSSKRLSPTSSSPSAPIKPIITKVIIMPPMPADVQHVTTRWNPATVEVDFQIKPRTIDATTPVESEMAADDKVESDSGSEDEMKENPPSDVVVQHDKALHKDQHDLQQGQIVRKRFAIMSPLPLDNHSPAKRRLEMNHHGNNQAIIKTNKPVLEKADENMSFNYTIGVLAWHCWVVNKNSVIEKNSFKQRPLKVELLQMKADELNDSLCFFVKEFRSPNGAEYAPGVIYYLVLGIQQYLYENGRIDNIFTDSCYERFTDCLDEVARRCSIHDLPAPVEEKHLWECKQLGPYSPYVLLNYLMFRTTAILKLRTVEEHMELSFSRIMKLLKRAKKKAKQQGRPPAEFDENPRKWKIYDYFEFYVFKCPESVKTRVDVFYLQPEKYWVPNSPIWYSTQGLSKEALGKMLRRIKMTTEINLALLSSNTTPQ